MTGAPFNLGVGSSNYRRMNLDTDPWSRRNRYRQWRDEVVDTYRLHGHDPRLWRVTQAAGEGGSIDVQLIRCEACGERQALPRRFPLRKRLEVGLCRGFLDETDARDRRRLRRQHLQFRAFFAVAFGLLAFGIGVATVNAPPENRAAGYFGVFLFMAVSVVAVVFYVRAYRSK